MKRSLTVLGVAVALGVAWWIGFAQSQEKQVKSKPVIFGSADEAKFREVVPACFQGGSLGKPCVISLDAHPEFDLILRPVLANNTGSVS